MDLEAAETIAIAGLAFLAEDARRLGRFLAETGVMAGRLHKNARAPRVLLAVVEHLLGTTGSLLLVFTTSAGIAPESVCWPTTSSPSRPPARSAHDWHRGANGS